ncbi:hypothetical protein BCV69DRAFT_281968 [Microstroma glucosiphilum]|uniref:Large ribosomal subunit protein bL28c n=1 Tax=Pseudomicrostroma glucosiphilum TaxID=1684307 RepID=A0A316UCD2_9BASI|nr:hypothetical protein BCV69DRAFT_281968 [Pseudomicrostroma glucosiphilum]PWN22063.1 hypothetical protein BCV69DRAFT_281968 [Pseudomicrostroma glucosiphilum]
MFPTLRLFSRTTYRGAAGSGPGRSGNTAFRSSPDSRKSPTDLASANWFKRSQRGLYDGAQLQTGNNVPESRQKTKRLFKPNVQRKAIWSEVLNEWVRLRLTTRGLRSIEKKGGLDQYIASTSDWKLGEFGRTLRTAMGKKARILQREAQLAQALAATAPKGTQPRATGRKVAASRAASDVDQTAQALEGMDIGAARAAEAT